MPERVSSDNPNLQAASTRLRRIQWTWAALFLAMAVLTVGAGTAGGALTGRIVLGAAWLAGGVLLAAAPQPALLALVAVAWALSLVFLLPGGGALGSDPLEAILGSSPVEASAAAVVRVLLALTAWNQFLFYRMLYGTATASGLETGLPAIPEVVPNRADALALAGRFCGLAGLMAAWAAIPLGDLPVASPVLKLGWALAVFGMGLGIGAAFSPTSRRAAALTGVGAGALAFLSALLAARAITG